MLSFKSLTAAAVIALGATSAQAITFTEDGSSVTLTDSGSGLVCFITNCGVSAALASGLDGMTFDLDNAGDMNSFDFLTFTGQGSGLTAFDITATLAFNPPSLSTTSGGSGGALLKRGTIIGGTLTWDDVPETYVLSDGSELSVVFAGCTFIFCGDDVTTSASVTLDSVGETSPVPLPASALMLLAGIGGLVGSKRLRKKTT